MTKEELEKEAVKYGVNNCGDCYGCHKKYRRNKNCERLKSVVKAYLAGAEPREKQITELSKHILELQKDKGELIDKVRDLEKENAELKHIIATLRQEKDNVSMHAKAMEVVAKTRSDQLTKAKTYLKYFIEILKKLRANKEPLVIESEQFLKDCEVEK